MVLACAFSPDGLRIVAASYEGTLKLWDTSAGVELATLPGHTDAVWAVAFSPDGRRIASASSDKKLKLWDATSGRELAALLGHEDKVYACSFSPDGSQIVSASEDQTVRLWDAATGLELATLAHEYSVSACAFSPDGTCIISYAVGLKVWNVQHRRVQATLWEGSGSFAISADARLVMSVGRMVKLWESRTGQEICEFHLRGRGTTVGWSPIAGIVAGTDAGMVYLLRPEGIAFDAAITTGLRTKRPRPRLTFWRGPETLIHAQCVFCTMWFGLSRSALGQEIDCPNCGQRLKLNPFTINADWRPIAEAWRGREEQS
jgi:WD40 repeat protein